MPAARDRRRAARSPRPSATAAGSAPGTPRRDPGPGRRSRGRRGSRRRRRSGARPATIERTVDLPQPEWPSSETNSPRCEREREALSDHRRPAGARSASSGPTSLEEGLHAAARPRATAQRRADARRLRCAACGRRDRGSAKRDRAGARAARETRPEHRARGPGVSGTIRSASRIASSTSLVMSTTRAPIALEQRARSRPAATRASARRARESGSSSSSTRGLHGERARDRDALAHAARELARALVRARPRGPRGDSCSMARSRRSARGRSPVHRVDRELRRCASAVSHGSSA